MTGFVFCHLVDSVVDGVKVAFLCHACDTHFILASAAFSHHTFLEVGLGVPNHVAEQFCKLSAVICLIDWGLACETDEKGNVLAPRGGKLRGTPGYMAPEQISVNPDAPEAGKHSDIFALGALLYAMITTSVPFQGKNRDDILYKTLTATPARFREAAPEGFFLPPELEPICFKAMSKDPAARYRSVDELREAVRNVQHNYFVAHLTAGRHRALVSGVILVLFILVAAAAFFLKNFLG